MTLQFSRRLALVFGILLPIVETARRWHQMGQLSMIPAWLDDYLVAALLLLAIAALAGALRPLPPPAVRL